MSFESICNQSLKFLDFTNSPWNAGVAYTGITTSASTSDCNSGMLIPGRFCQSQIQCFFDC